MSRISLMVLVVLSLVVSQLVSTNTATTVVDARENAAEEARGGAANCAMDMMAGYCFTDGVEAPCTQIPCDKTFVPTFFGYGYYTYNCSQTGRLRLRWMWWNCVTWDSPPFLPFPSTTCGPLTQDWCYSVEPCYTDCLDVNGIQNCVKQFPIPNNPIFNGAFDESRGDQVECSINYFASANNLQSTIAFALPSFTRYR